MAAFRTAKFRARPHQALPNEFTIIGTRCSWSRHSLESCLRHREVEKGQDTNVAEIMLTRNLQVLVGRPALAHRLRSGYTIKRVRTYYCFRENVVPAAARCSGISQPAAHRRQLKECAPLAECFRRTDRVDNHCHRAVRGAAR